MSDSSGGSVDGSLFPDIRLLSTDHIMSSFFYIWRFLTLHSDEIHSFSENLTRSNKMSIDLRRSLLALVRFALDLTDLRHAAWSWGGRQLLPIWLLQTQSFFGWQPIILIVNGSFEILKLDIVGLGAVWWAIQLNLTHEHPE